MIKVACARRSSALVAWASISSGVMLVAACGGGGGGASDAGTEPVSAAITGRGAATASGPGDTTTLMPMDFGATWLYDTTDPDTNTVGLQTVAVTGAHSVSGVSATAFSVSSTLPNFTAYDEYFTSSGGGITSYGTSDNDDWLGRDLVPYVVLRFPLATGTMSHVIGSKMPAGSDASGNPLTADVDHRVVFAGTESLTLTAGVFPDAVKVVTSVTATVTNATLKQSASLTGTDVRWFAPGVGMVQEVATIGASRQTWSLRGYTVGGIARGWGASRTVASGVGSPSAELPPQAAAGGGTAMTLHVSGQMTTAYLTDAAGALRATLPIADGSRAVLGFDGTNYLIASLVVNGGNPALALKRVTPAGASLDPAAGKLIYTSISPTANSPVALAAGGKNALLVFSSSAGAPSSLYGLLVNLDGSAPAAPPFLIAHGANDYQGSAAFDGSNFIVVWRRTPGSGGDQVEATRVSASGALLDATPLKLSSGVSWTSTPTIAFDGTHYLAVWADGVVPPASMAGPHLQVWGTRISKAGVVVDGMPNAGGIRISSSEQRNLVGPAVAFNGAEHLVVWTDAGYCCDQYKSIRGVRVAPSGRVSSGANFEMKVGERATSLPSIAAGPSGPVQVGWTSDGTVMTVSAHPF